MSDDIREVLSFYEQKIHKIVKADLWLWGHKAARCRELHKTQIYQGPYLKRRMDYWGRVDTSWRSYSF